MDSAEWEVILGSFLVHLQNYRVLAYSDSGRDALVGA